jgi:hypothetical protein
MGFGPARPTDLENPERTFEQQKPQDKEEMVDSLEDMFDPQGAGKKERGAIPDNTNLLPPLLEPPAAS